MKIALISVGTRGDMEPFLAIAQLLNKRGHQVLCAFPDQFRSITEESDIPFASLGKLFIELLESDAGKAAMGGASGWKKFAGTLQLAMQQKDANKELLFKQREIINKYQPDCILYNGKAIYPIIWHLLTGGKIIFISPLPFMHYVKGHTHIAFNANYGEFFNKLTFSLANFGIITTVGISRKWLKVKERLSRKAIKSVIEEGKSIYTISPSLFAKPKEWPEQLKVLGYHFRSQVKSEWAPSNELKTFIEKHDKILFITFGSMVNPSPEINSQIFLEILMRHQIPTIINTASGGLIQPLDFTSDLIHFVSQIPYDHILDKVYAMIHHGGSGTTHMGLKFGCASMIIPHIIDQFVWNRILANLGVGPKGIKINKISSQNLEPLLLDLMNNPNYKTRAEEVAKQMNQEDFDDELYEAITTN